MKEQTHQCNGPFKMSRDYNFKVMGLHASGTSADLHSGLILHEFDFLSDLACKLPVTFPEGAIWAGVVTKGPVTVQLPDLGRITIKEGHWFIAKLNDCQFINPANTYSRIISFSFCGCMMKKMARWADSSLQKKLAGLSAPTPLLPLFLQGKSDETLLNLSQSLQIADYKMWDTTQQVEHRAKNWMTTLFKQNEWFDAPAEAFGATPHIMKKEQ